MYGKRGKHEWRGRFEESNTQPRFVNSSRRKTYHYKAPIEATFDIQFNITYKETDQERLFISYSKIFVYKFVNKTNRKI